MEEQLFQRQTYGLQTLKILQKVAVNSRAMYLHEIRSIVHECAVQALIPRTRSSGGRNSRDSLASNGHPIRRQLKRSGRGKHRSSPASSVCYNLSREGSYIYIYTHQSLFSLSTVRARARALNRAPQDVPATGQERERNRDSGLFQIFAVSCKQFALCSVAQLCVNLISEGSLSLSLFRVHIGTLRALSSRAADGRRRCICIYSGSCVTPSPLAPSKIDTIFTSP